MPFLFAKLWRATSIKAIKNTAGFAGGQIYAESQARLTSLP